MENDGWFVSLLSFFYTLEDAKRMNELLALFFLSVGRRGIAL